MSQSHRHTGGQSAKRGTRYEDYFVVARLIEYAPRAFAGAVVRVKEQVDCPLDDLLLRESDNWHYHQLKTSPDITWSADEDKIASEFGDQQRQCVAGGQAYRLYLVVAHEHRAGLLREKVPPVLQSTTVLCFPILQRPSQLADLRGRLGSSFDTLRASRFPSRTADQTIASAFFLAYAEHQPDGEGYCVLSQLMADLWARCQVHIRRETSVGHPRWAEAEALLRKVEGLEWWTDRGWFEWQFRQLDKGLAVPVDEEPFLRFVDRILDAPPKTFADFERALP